MKGPLRMADDPRSPVRGLVRAAIDDDPPPGATRRALVSLGLAAGATAASVSTAHASASSAAGTTAAVGAKPVVVASLAGKWVFGIALVSGVAGGTAVVVNRYEPAAPLPRVTAAVSRPSPPASPRSLAPRPVLPAVPVGARVGSAGDPPAPSVPGAIRAEAPPMSVARRATAIVNAAPPSREANAVARDPISDEVALLDGARRALANGEASRAVALLDSHAGRFPASGLGPEAVLLRIEALVRAGRSNDARVLGQSALAGHLATPYAARIRALTGL